MKVSSSLIRKGYIAAGVSNIAGILIFSLGFQNERLTAQYPEVFSRFGIISILLWGLAYLSVAGIWEKTRALAAVFAIEKLVYVVTWLLWMADRGGELPALLSEDPLTGIFYLIYGPNDLLFMGLFILAFRAASAHPSRR